MDLVAVELLGVPVNPIRYVVDFYDTEPVDLGRGRFVLGHRSKGRKLNLSEFLDRLAVLVDAFLHGSAHQLTTISSAGPRRESSAIASTDVRAPLLLGLV